MSHPRQYWRAAVLGFALAACAGAAEQDFGFGGPADQTARVSVQNQYFGEIAVYVVEGSSRRRLGTVSALSEATFTVPEDLVGTSVQLHANPVSLGTAYTSRHLVIPQGSNVELRLSDELPLSDFIIR